MSLYIIHLTDIHINNADDIILSKVDHLAQRCLSDILHPADVIVAVTGDITYAGKEHQYQLFHQFINGFLERLRASDCVKSVNIFTVPGNHDCDFDLETGVRKVLRQSTPYRNTDDFNIDCVSQITKEVQSSYLEYSEKNYNGLSSDNVIFRDDTVETEQGKIAVLLYNSAWFSTLDEEAGHLCMPINLIPKVDILGYDFVVALMHHPLNWLHPDNKASFDRILRSSVDLVLCGHEHYCDEVLQQGEGWSYQILEGKELQEKSKTNKSAFAMYIFDPTFTMLEIRHYEWKDKEYTFVYNNTQTFSRNQANARTTFNPNTETLHFLEDVGVIYSNPYTETINLSDVFVWPMLEEATTGQSDTIINIDGKDLFHRVLQNPITIIHGAESYGKSTLAKQLYKICIGEGKCCLLGKGTSFSARKKEAIYHEIDSLFSDQYSSSMLGIFHDLTKDSRILLIDDFDQITYSNEKIRDFIDILSDYFGTIVLFSENHASIPFLMTRVEVGDIPSYRIKQLGSLKRNELITKWYSLGNNRAVYGENEFLALIDRATRTISDFLGRYNRLVPSTPLTILSLLQTIDTTGSTVINGNSYAYERLIESSLDLLSNRSQAHRTIYVSVLSLLAYKMLEEKVLAISSTNLTEAISKYIKESLLNVDVIDIINKLSKSQMLVCNSEGMYRFRYPYLYYYFCARYIAKNIQSPSVKEQIEYMSSRLHVVEYGNIMIFICHFINNEAVLQSIILSSLCTLDGIVPFDFNKPYSMLDDVFADVKPILDRAKIGEESDVASTRQRDLAYHDQHSRDEEDIFEDQSTSITDDSKTSTDNALSDITSAFRIIDVLGQILRNYPGEISGTNKKEAIGEIKELSMRVINIMYCILNEAREDIVVYVVETLREQKKKMTDAELEQHVRTLLNRMIFAFVSGIVHKASYTIATPLLVPALETIANENCDDPAFELMLCDAEMFCSDNPKYDYIMAVNQKLKRSKSKYAQDILRFFVASHLRRRKCGDRIRDRLCAEFLLRKTDLLLPQSTTED